MDLQDIHKRILFLANKDFHFWSPAEIDTNLHMAQMWLYNETYRNYAKDQEQQDSLSPFKVKYTFTTSNTPLGVISFSADYLHFLGLYTQLYNNTYQRNEYYQVKVVNEDELGQRLNSQLTPVSLTKPIATISAFGKVQLYPELPNTGYAFYLKKPDTPNFVYTMTGRTVNYNQAGSTQLQWNDTDTNQIIIKALQLMGVNISNPQIVQFTENKDQQKI